MPIDASGGSLQVKDSQGKITLDASRRYLRVAEYKQGTITLPRVLLDNGGNSSIDQVYDLGAVGSDAQVLSGAWRVSNMEGYAPGSRSFYKTHNRNTYYYYAPRVNTSDWFTAAGLGFVDIYRWSQSSATAAREIGDVFHALQFYLEGGQVKLRRSGMGISQFTARFRVFYGHPSIYTVHGDVNDCVALTIEYRLWLGTFT